MVVLIEMNYICFIKLALVRTELADGNAWTVLKLNSKLHFHRFHFDWKDSSLQSDFQVRQLHREMVMHQRLMTFFLFLKIAKKFS